MKRGALAIIALLFLSGCVTSPIPENYSGPLATIRDTAVPEGSNRVQFFYVREIDGQTINNVLFASRGANHGRGPSLIPVRFARDVPARQATFTLEGKVAYGAPIQELINSGTLWNVQKKITFTPKSNATYIVRGVLKADRQEIWLEDDAGERVE